MQIATAIITSTRWSGAAKIAYDVIMAKFQKRSLKAKQTVQNKDNSWQFTSCNPEQHNIKF